MSEMRLEPSEPTPPPSRRSPPAPDLSQGSLAAGVGLAWAIVVGGHFAFGIVAAFVLTALPHAFMTVVIWPLAFLPELAAVLVAIWLIQRGRKRTGIGILVGLASIFAVTLLLVAACFGLLFLSNH